MVNDAVTGAAEAERALALSYAPAGVRPALTALLALDAALGAILRSTTQTIVGQLRLAWWRDALAALDDGAPPAEPVLAALFVEIVARGVAGARLAAMVDGWEALLDAPLSDERLREHALARGATLFLVAGEALGAAPTDPLAAAGQGWALADLSRHLSDPAAADRARAMASSLLAQACAVRWSRAARATGALAQLARMDLAGGTPGRPARTWRLLRHRLTGR